jgi:hypothetical protein
MNTVLLTSSDRLFLDKRYRMTLSVLAFPETFASILETFKNIVTDKFEYEQGKHVQVMEVFAIPDSNKICIEFILLENSPVVGVVVGCIIAILGIAGVLLTLDKVEEIIDSPAGIGIGIWLVLGAVIFGMKYLKNLKASK